MKPLRSSSGGCGANKKRLNQYFNASTALSVVLDTLRTRYEEKVYGHKQRLRVPQGPHAHCNIQGAACGGQGECGRARLDLHVTARGGGRPMQISAIMLVALLVALCCRPSHSTRESFPPKASIFRNRGPLCNLGEVQRGPHSANTVPHPAALQWEQIKPVGMTPSARYGHAAVTMDSMQGMHFIFGGHGTNGTWTPSGLLEVYMLDGPAQVYL